MKHIPPSAIPFAAGAAAALVVCALFGAFSAGSPAESSAPSDEAARDALRKARAKLEAGRPKEAEAIYRDLSLSRPLDGNAHLLLGIHLQDLAKDPFGAIGQFNDFLRLAPESDKADMVRERIHACELAIAKRFRGQDAGAGAAPEQPVSAASAARLQAYAEALAASREETAGLRSELEEVRSERDRLKRDNAAKQNQIDALKGRGSSARAPTDSLSARFDRLTERDYEEAGAGSGGPAAANVPSPSGPPVRLPEYMTYEVRRGDTLWKIAQTAYHDGSRTAEIKAANPGLVGADGSLREGTILRIPR